MTNEAQIYLGDEDEQDGHVEVEFVGNEIIMLHFKINGRAVASAELDRFSAGFLAGSLSAAAEREWLA